jgi:hypothetical protein
MPGDLQIEDGVRVYKYQWLLTLDHELYAFEGGLFTVWSPAKASHVDIDPIGMSPQEVIRAIEAADAVLARAEPALNRRQRRAAAKGDRSLN